MEKSSAELFLASMLVLKQSINLSHKYEKLDIEPGFRL